MAAVVILMASIATTEASSANESQRTQASSTVERQRKVETERALHSLSDDRHLWKLGQDRLVSVEV